MASFPKLFSVIFLLALSSSLVPKIQARESQFFAKVQTTNANDNYNVKQSSEQEQDSRFQRGTQNYGISGETRDDSTGARFLPDSTTAATTDSPYKSKETVYDYYNRQNGYFPTATTAAKSAIPDQNNYYTNAAEKYNYQWYNGGQPTTTAAAAATTSIPDQNSYYTNAAEKYNYDNQYVSTRSGEQNGYNTQQQEQKNSFNPQQQQQQRQQQYGMSDTRYMYNGKYYYDVAKENNVNGYNPQGAASTNHFGTNTYAKVYNYGTNGAQAGEEEEDKFVP